MFETGIPVSKFNR